MTTSPHNDFTDRVMKGVKARPRKIGLWNLLYLLPILIAVTLLTMPSTRENIQSKTNPQYATANKVQDDVDAMQQLVDELEVFSNSDINNINYAGYSSE